LKSKRIILFFLLLSALLPPTYAADYGEDEDYLGQVVDDYETNDNVTAVYNVIHNATLDCMELVYGASEDMILQNFLVYTEVDELNGIVVNDYDIDAILQRNKNRYVYYDFGVDYFGSFKVYGKFRQDYHNSDGAWGIFSMFSNFVGNEQEHRDNNEEYLGWNIGGSAGNFKLFEYTGAGFFGTANKPMVDDTYFWFKMEKIGDVGYIDVYTTEALRDAEGNGNWYDDDMTLQSDYNFRYFYVCNSHDDGQTQEMNMELYDFYLNGTLARYESSGHYYTVESLKGDVGLVLMYNDTIPANTGITAEFSADNSTWVDHDNLPGSDTLIAGFESLDLRDLNTTSLYIRFNMTSSTGVNTPRIHQIRIVTITNVTIGNGETVYVDTLFPGLAIGISLLIIAVIYLIEKRR